MWLDDMKRDIVSIMHPNFELLPEDEIIVRFDASDGWGMRNDAGDTYEDPYFYIYVTVKRNRKFVWSGEVNGVEACGIFLRKLMTKGTEHAQDRQD